MTTDQDTGIAELLNSLGSDPDEVAEKLASDGIRYIRSVDTPYTSTCPLALWLTAQLGVPCSVGTFYARPVDGARPRTLMPKPVKDFVSRFDSGGYPQLREPA